VEIKEVQQNSYSQKEQSLKTEELEKLVMIETAKQKELPKLLFNISIFKSISNT